MDMSNPENIVLMKEVAELENKLEPKTNTDHDDIINVTLIPNEPNIKRKFNIHVIKVVVLLLIITTLTGLLFGFSDDPHLPKESLQFSYINLTRTSTTTTMMTTTTGKCSLQINLFFTFSEFNTNEQRKLLFHL